MKIEIRNALYALVALSALSLAACKSPGETTDAPATSSAPTPAAPADASAPPPTSGDGG
ncbi:hypothetical protein [Lysobacter sp. CA199]|uniref:hypothetical protein n=1 Tax=Lysobacter sp. CA199 TaxID=3455608 RepID=UPI003F8D5699